jgi:hypothetical protein
MLNKAIQFLKNQSVKHRINRGLSRAAALGANCDGGGKMPSKPIPWEFSGFSQNGEDGIIDYLMQKIINPNYYFIEIGAADGIENNTAWLAIARKYCGLMIEGNEKLSSSCKRIMSGINLGVESLPMFVNKDTISELSEITLTKQPDFFSLDIDGNDYYIASTLMEHGFQPKVWAVEYNSAYGPEKSITIEYKKDFVHTQAHKTALYYGVSITGWRNFFAKHGYRFITVERNGVNAFFAHEKAFDKGFLNSIDGFDFRENFYQMTKFKKDWQEQFALIKDMPFKEIR